MKTLAVRMREHCANARRIAEFLESHPAVERVRYPGLESHPQHELARSQMDDFGGMISFDVAGSEEDALEVAPLDDDLAARPRASAASRA